MREAFEPWNDPESCKMVTRRGGHQAWNSPTHCCITLKKESKIIIAKIRITTNLQLLHKTLLQVLLNGITLGQRQTPDRFQ